MARLPHFDISDQPQHAIQRGNLRSITLKKLKDAFQKFQCNLHAHVLMTNHVHLLITPHLKSGIGKVIGGLRKRRKKTIEFDPNDFR